MIGFPQKEGTRKQVLQKKKRDKHNLVMVTGENHSNRGCYRYYEENVLESGRKIKLES